ncbi:hypothetical protein [Pollutibacter soli]|uniref:hypothetical protein n=1 Tax=Pollutibacter soli TaxID=3034157 RepID=UPI00301383ED
MHEPNHSLQILQPLKWSLFLLIILFNSIETIAQQKSVRDADTKYSIVDSSLYLKGKKQHKQGILLLTVGGGAVTLGLVTAALGYAYSYSDAPLYVGVIIFFAGAGAMIASIPVLIGSHNKINRSRVRLTFKTTPIQPLPQFTKYIPSVGLSFAL